MMVSLLLDVTLDLGYWVVTRVGSGVINLARYAFAGSTGEDEPLAIEPARQPTAEALDAAAVLRGRGALDDDAYIMVVRSLIEGVVDDGQSARSQNEAANREHVKSPETQNSHPAPLPSAPPAYERLFDAKLNLKGS